MKLALTLLILLLVLTSTGQNADSFGYYGNLERGKYNIGYKTFNLTDYTRSYHGWGRPLQIYMWYPAQLKSRKHSMHYQEYFNDAGNDWGKEKDQSSFLYNMLLRDFRSGALNPSFAGSLPDSTFSALLNTHVPVVRNAPPQNGIHPLVLHVTANGALHQSLMLEYLASHGYVVMSISMYGSAPAHYGRGETGVAGLAAMADDLAFALSFARSLPVVDTTRIAVIGMLAQAGVALQMKGIPIDALVCLDCHADVSLLKALPYYDVRKVRSKIMQIHNSQFPADNSFLKDSAVYASRSVVFINNLKHPDFYPFPKIVNPSSSVNYREHELILEHTRAFLDSTLRNANIPPRSPSAAADSVKFMAAKEAVPTESEFLGWLRYGKLDTAIESWNKHGASLVQPDNLFAVVLFLARDKAPHAKEAFNMFQSAFPQNPRLNIIRQFLE